MFRNVWKKFGRVVALRDASFAIPRGVVAGLVGPNGSGKTTSFRLCLGFIKPSEGVVEVLGRNPWRDESVREEIGYLPEKPIYPPDVTIEALLEHGARLRGLSSPEHEARRVAKIVGIAELMSRPVSAVSRGQLQRVGLAYALLGEPSLLLLDEPTANLDPAARIEILRLIKTVARDMGATAIVSTHILPEMEIIADYLVVLVDGMVVDYGSVGEVAIRHRAPITYTIVVDADHLRKLAAALISDMLADAVEVDDAGRVLRVRVRPDEKNRLDQLLEELRGKGIVESYRVESADLLQLYRRLVPRGEGV